MWTVGVEISKHPPTKGWNNIFNVGKGMVPGGFRPNDYPTRSSDGVHIGDIESYMSFIKGPCSCVKLRTLCLHLALYAPALPQMLSFFWRNIIILNVFFPLILWKSKGLSSIARIHLYAWFRVNFSLTLTLSFVWNSDLVCGSACRWHPSLPPSKHSLKEISLGNITFIPSWYWRLVVTQHYRNFFYVMPICTNTV